MILSKGVTFSVSLKVNCLLHSGKSGKTKNIFAQVAQSCLYLIPQMKFTSETELQSELNINSSDSK